MDIAEVCLFTMFTSQFTDIASDQEMIWIETIADTPALESDARQGELTPTNMNPKLNHDIQVLLSRLIGKANQLLGNETTNLAECWMHIRSKFDGGKVINRSQSGSWEHRCMGAGLRQNMGREWGPQVWKQMTTSSPNKVYIDAADHSAKKLSKDNKRKATDTVKAKRRKSKYTRLENTTAARRAYSRHDGGILPDEITDDISQENLEQLKYSFYKTKVVITREEARTIEVKTRDQADCEMWNSERRKRITASKVGSIAKMREKTKRSNKVREFLYSTFRGNEATRFGSVMEEVAKQEYITHRRRNYHPEFSAKTCGLFISEQNNWLAATPDGMVNDPSNIAQPLGIIEIKNPFSVRDKDLIEACSSSSFCLELNKENNTTRLKRRHDYYYQIQCQLYCTDLSWCDFILRTNKGIHIERIHREQAWWSGQLEKLKTFYFDALLPELAVPRHRSGGIREPTN